VIRGLNRVLAGEAESELWILNHCIAQALSAYWLPSMDEFRSLHLLGDGESLEVLAKVVPVDCVESDFVPVAHCLDVVASCVSIHMVPDGGVVFSG
jgi:hypothetical protein